MLVYAIHVQSIVALPIDTVTFRCFSSWITAIAFSSSGATVTKLTLSRFPYTFMMSLNPCSKGRIHCSGWAPRFSWLINGPSRCKPKIPAPAELPSWHENCGINCKHTTLNSRGFYKTYYRVLKMLQDRSSSQHLVTCLYISGGLVTIVGQYEVTPWGKSFLLTLATSLLKFSHGKEKSQPKAPGRQ